MENLRTYPVVKKAAREGRLFVHAWFFEIASGTVYGYSPEKGQFGPIHSGEKQTGVRAPRGPGHERSPFPAGPEPIGADGPGRALGGAAFLRKPGGPPGNRI